MVAMVVSLLMILLTFGSASKTWRFGIAAIAALAHDVLFTVGLLGPQQRLAPYLGFALVDPFKIDLTIIAAILTIIRFLDQRHHRDLRSHS